MLSDLISLFTSIKIYVCAVYVCECVCKQDLLLDKLRK